MPAAQSAVIVRASSTHADSSWPEDMRLGLRSPNGAVHTSKPASWRCTRGGGGLAHQLLLPVRMLDFIFNLI
jgi:hypothetical protein